LNSADANTIPFYLLDEETAVGTFAFEGRPHAPGEYAYIPCRSLAHHRLVESLRAGIAVSSWYEVAGKRVVFEVTALVSYGRLQLRTDAL
jgi:hypothetical protein